MQMKPLHRCSHIVLLCVTHGGQKTDPFLVETQQADRTDKLVAKTDFPLIGNMAFDREKGIAIPVPALGRQTDGVHEGIGRAVEDENIVSDIKVTVIVDPFLLNRRAVQLRHIARRDSRRDSRRHSHPFLLPPARSRYSNGA